jgi:hypothetical protein
MLALDASISAAFFYLSIPDRPCGALQRHGSNRKMTFFFKKHTHNYLFSSVKSHFSLTVF